MNHCRSHARAAACVLALLLSLGCPDTPKEAAPAPVPEGASTPPTTKTEGVAIPPAQPAMLAKVGSVDLPPANPPASWTAGWKLAPGARWEYAYTQQIQAVMASEAGAPKQGMEVTGTLVVSAKDDSAADVELTDAKSVVTMQVAGQPEQKMEQPLPPKTYGALLKTSEEAPAPEDPLVYAILAVPQKAGAVGDVVVKQLSMPVDAPEGEVKAEGTATWTLKGFVKCGEHTCAHYSHDVDIAKVTPPAGAKGKYGARARAIGWTLVDIDDGALHRHKSATHLRLKAEIPAEAAAPGHGGASQPAEPATMDMTQEHFHELVRSEVKSK